MLFKLTSGPRGTTLLHDIPSLPVVVVVCLIVSQLLASYANAARYVPEHDSPNRVMNDYRSREMRPKPKGPAHLRRSSPKNETFVTRFQIDDCVKEIQNLIGQGVKHQKKFPPACCNALSATATYNREVKEVYEANCDKGKYNTWMGIGVGFGNEKTVCINIETGVIQPPKEDKGHYQDDEHTSSCPKCPTECSKCKKSMHENSGSVTKIFEEVIETSPMPSSEAIIFPTGDISDDETTAPPDEQ